MVLGSLLVLPLVYVVAQATNPSSVVARIKSMSLLWIAVLSVGFLLLGGSPSIGTPLVPALSVTNAIEFSNRLFGISLVGLFIIATIGKPSRRRMILIGVVTLGMSIASGSRMSSVIIAALIITAPSLRMAWKGRVSLAVVGVVLLSSALAVPEVRQRWFVGDEGSIVDIVTFSSNIDTSGRSELWSSLVPTCNERWLFGRGIGASNQLSVEYSNGRIDQPHNEYLRVYCDTGLVGSLLFWSVPIAVGVRAIGSLRRKPETAISVAALQFLAALLLLSLIDNVLMAAVQFTAPAFIVFAWSDRAHSDLIERSEFRSSLRQSGD